MSTVDPIATATLREKLTTALDGQPSEVVLAVALDLTCRVALALKIQDKMPEVVEKRIAQIVREVAMAEAGIHVPSPEDQKVSS